MIMERRGFFKVLAAGMAALGLTSLLPKPLAPLATVPPCSSLLKMSNGRVLVHSMGIWFGNDYREYEAAIIEDPGPGTWHVYAEDPEYKGGFVPFVATQDESEIYKKNGRIYFGRITT